jgi:2'-5' RNA ligase
VTRSRGRTALVVPVPRADPIVEPWRALHDRDNVARRIPTHLTVLFPFVPGREVDEPLLERLRDLLAPVAPIDFALTSVRSWPGTVFLVPEPSAPLVALIDRVRAAFPERPLYGDPSLDPAPHVTIATEPDAERLGPLAEELRRSLATLLPLTCRADVVWLMLEQADGTWERRASFPLSASSC